jgi:hypothetical protein
LASGASAEGHRRGVGHQRDRGGLDRLEAQPDEHDRADRHRRTEAREGLEQGAEAEGDEHCLHALVVAEAPERAADHREVTAALEHVEDPDRVDDDEHDREQPEDGALGAGVECLPEGHRVDDDRDQERHRQRPDGGDMGLQLEPAQQHEQRDEGQDREDRRQAERIADRVEHLLVHGRLLPWQLDCGWSYPGRPQMRPGAC